ncbi:MAG: HAD-IIB family hydrolase [Spirochaetales bacterium]|nr:HAD-IIB family hydrolase [Spirochaetales bacterium]
MYIAIIKINSFEEAGGELSLNKEFPQWPNERIDLFTYREGVNRNQQLTGKRRVITLNPASERGYGEFRDHYVERLVAFFQKQGRFPDLIHGADSEGEFVAAEIAAYYQIPLYERESKLRFSPDEELIERMGSIEHLLISDFDNTLTGDQRAIDELKIILDKYYPKLGFAIATGRHIDSTLDGLAQYDFPLPDLIISGVGAQIFYGVGLMEDEGWSHYIKSQWNGDKIIYLLEEFKEFNPRYRFTSPGESRVSYYIDYDVKNERLVEKIREILDSNELAYHLIYSHGHYIDIIPYRASKGAAVDHVIGRWNLNPQQVVTAGDSANDFEMFTREINGIIVANYEEALEPFQGQKHLFFSPSPYARGLLEGLRHFKVIE